MEDNNNPTSVSTRIIDYVDVNQIETIMTKINQFQSIVQRTLKQNLDYGIIPNTGKKPTLLKPGAEKILMLLGLRSEFDIVDKTRDFDNGFFQYQVKCKLYKGEVLITEGMGSCNTKESKYKKSDGFSVDNTVLKMAKKRALVDAALMVGSLSDIFSQDLEDLDIEGHTITTDQPPATDQDGTINKQAARQLFAAAGGNEEIVRAAMKKHNYEKSIDIKKTDYNKILDEIKTLINSKEEADTEVEPQTESTEPIPTEPSAPIEQTPTTTRTKKTKV